MPVKFLFAVLFIFSFQANAQSTYPFSGNQAQVALWSPINKCGSSSSAQFKWIGDAAIYPASCNYCKATRKS